MSQPLYLVHMPVSLPDLARFSYERNRGALLRRRRDGREAEAGFDDGRVLHHVLDETFGPAALRPFRLMIAPGARTGSIYAYSRVGKHELLTAAAQLGPPETRCILGLDRMSEREMPLAWNGGRRLGFDVRIRPVVRVRTGLSDPRRALGYRAGAELDAYYVEAQRAHPRERPSVIEGIATPSGMSMSGRTREVVYRDWLAAQLGDAAAIIAERTSMSRFRRTRVSRSGPAPEGPDAVLNGELVVGDPAAFASLLVNGIGRHKAYGYGMLMLRPARRAHTEP
jgi:CRISPR system Cascade subunit CasE